MLLAACGGGTENAAPPAGAGDTTAPTVQATSPSPSASGVAASAQISVTFSEAVDATTLTNASFTVSAGGTAVTGSVSASGSTATFAPAAPLAAGVSYTATLSTAVKDTAGNALAAAHVWSFTTVPAAAPTWGPPLLLETADGTASQPAVAAPSGPGGGTAAIAVWIQHDGTQPSVYANRFEGGAWRGAVLIEQETAIGGATAGGAAAPKVAMGPSGAAVFGWVFDDGNGGYSIWGSSFDGSFDAARARRISSGNNASGPQLSFDADGYDAFAIWTEYDPARPPAAYRITHRPHLFVQCPAVVACLWDPADYGWRSATLAETAPFDSIEPQIAGFGSGSAVAVWAKAQGVFGLELWANTYSKAGGWASAVRVNPLSASRAEQIVVAAAADGVAVTTWIESVGGRRTVFASRLGAAGWSAPLAVDDATAGNADTPQVGVDGGGHFSLVWIQNVAGVQSLLARRCPPGALTGCGAPTTVGGLPGHSERPRLAVAPSGDAFVATTQTDAAGRRSIHATRFAATTGWDPNPALIDVDAGGAELAVDGAGRGTIVWTKTDAGGRQSVYASRSN